MVVSYLLLLKSSMLSEWVNGLNGLSTKEHQSCRLVPTLEARKLAH